jgi:hypothetical protein
MAEVTLDAPLTLDPKQATRLVIRYWHVEPDAGVVQVGYDLFDASGKLLERRAITADGAQVQTWIANNTNTIYTRLLAKLGVTGTVA